MTAQERLAQLLAGRPPSNALTRSGEGPPITYQDYLHFMGDRGGALSETQWNALSTQEKFNNVQGGVLLGRDDPRYADMARQLRITNGSNIMLGGGPMAHAGDPNWYVDPHAVVTGDGWHATGQENQTPHAQQQANASGLTGQQWAAIAAAIAGGGAYAGFTGAGTGALEAGAGGAFDMGGSAGVFDSMGYPLYPGGMDPGLLPGTTPGYTPFEADYPGNQPWTPPDGGPPPEPFENNYPGNQPIDPGMPPGSPPPGSPPGTQPPAPPPGTPPGTPPPPTPNLLDQAGRFAANPLVRGALGLAATLAGARGSSGTSGSSSGSGGAPGAVGGILEQMANANRYDWNTPFGARHWTQDASGHWTVNDSLSPEEQANYEGVRSMNGNVTGMAQQRLASMLAAPRRQRADRPINFGADLLGA